MLYFASLPPHKGFESRQQHVKAIKISKIDSNIQGSYKGRFRNLRRPALVIYTTAYAKVDVKDNIRQAIYEQGSLKCTCYIVRGFKEPYIRGHGMWTPGSRFGRAVSPDDWEDQPKETQELVWRGAKKREALAAAHHQEDSRRGAFVRHSTRRYTPAAIIDHRRTSDHFFRSMDARSAHRRPGGAHR